MHGHLSQEGGDGVECEPSGDDTNDPEGHCGDGGDGAVDEQRGTIGPVLRESRPAFAPAGLHVRAVGMARKLKTYQTSIGFFDLAIAAPSMKAALEAWESSSNLFHQGFARETTDPAIVKATMDKPGVVLRRTVGTKGAFAEHAELPSDFSTGEPKKVPTKAAPKVQETPAHKTDKRAVCHAALVSEKEQKRLEAERRMAEAAREREARRRSRAIAKLEAALETINEEHERAIADIENERAVFDKGLQQEVVRWENQKEQIEAKLRQARG
jgi:colicin import membrane protein